MSKQLTVNLPSEKTYEYLLRYFKLKENIDVMHSEPSYIRLHAGGCWDREYASCNVEIKMHPEEDKTRMTFDFGFRDFFIMTLVSGVLILAIIWLVPWAFYVSIKHMIGEQPYSITYSAVFSVVWVSFFLFMAPYTLSKTKRKLPDDIRKAFALLNKMD